MVAPPRLAWPPLIKACTRVRLKLGRRSERKSVEPQPRMALIGLGREALLRFGFAFGRHEVFRTMAVASEPDNTPLPGTVFTPRQVRVLKIAVIVMGLLLVGGFAFVLAAIVYQASRGGQSTPSAEAAAGAGTSEAGPALSELPIPKDATVTSLALDGDRLALHLTSPAGGEIAVIDVRSGKVIARIKLKPE